MPQAASECRNLTAFVRCWPIIAPRAVERPEASGDHIPERIPWSIPAWIVAPTGDQGDSGIWSARVCAVRPKIKRAARPFNAKGPAERNHAALLAWSRKWRRHGEFFGPAGAAETIVATSGSPTYDQREAAAILQFRHAGMRRDDRDPQPGQHRLFDRLVIPILTTSGRGPPRRARNLSIQDACFEPLLARLFDICSRSSMRIFLSPARRWLSAAISTCG